jgi:UDP-glucose 4-epimerase
MRVLVTGGAGFIGSHVADTLLAAGHEVAILDNLSSGKRANIDPRATFYECDLRDPQVATILAEYRPEVISHHAAQMSVRISIDQPLLDASVNIQGTLNLLEGATRAGVRKIIYASTGGAAYGEPRYLPCDEAHPVHPLSHYGITKHTVEHYLELYAGLYGLDYTALRYPNVFGPRQDPEGEAGVVAIFARRMLRNLPLAIFGDGRQERDFVAVGDVARATLAALESGGGTIINLGSGVGTSVQTIFERLAALTDYRRAPEFRPVRPGEVYRIYLTNERARDLLGWMPTIALDDALAVTVAWVREELAREDHVAAEQAVAAG